MCGPESSSLPRVYILEVADEKVHISVTSQFSMGLIEVQLFSWQVLRFQSFSFQFIKVPIHFYHDTEHLFCCKRKLFLSFGGFEQFTGIFVVVLLSCFFFFDAALDSKPTGNSAIAGSRISDLMLFTRTRPTIHRNEVHEARFKT